MVTLWKSTCLTAFIAGADRQAEIAFDQRREQWRSKPTQSEWAERLTEEYSADNIELVSPIRYRPREMRVIHCSSPEDEQGAY